MHSRCGRLFVLLPLFALVFAVSCTNPRVQAQTAQALNDAANEINGLQSDIADLSTQLDSLRSIVAHQDTTIRRIAAVYNVPISE